MDLCVCVSDLYGRVVLGEFNCIFVAILLMLPKADKCRENEV